MPRSTWKLHLDSSSEDSANQITNQYDNLSWSEVVYETIEIGQRLGSGWSIFGKICEESNAVFSKNAGNHIIIPGVN